VETDVLARLAGAARTVTPVAPVTPATLGLPQLRAGESVRAEVAAELGDGTFRVVIDARAFRLALPAGIKQGDALELRVVPDGSRLALVTASPQNPTRTAVSDAGRFIGALLREPPGLPPRQPQPIVRNPPAAPSDLAAPLARAVERSGLFYESHQARWVGGDYPLERLREEPQAAWTRASGPAPPALASATAEATSPGHPTRTPGPEIETRAASTPALAADEGPKGETPRADLAARETLPLVRQQLDTLDTRQISWLGEIWPGQTLRWEIAADDGGGGGESSDEAQWRTRFGLSLPQLGELGAVLSLGPQGVRISLSAQAPETLGAMRASLDQLVRALEAAGVAVAGVQAHRDAAPI
jgi:hypothetical protein